MCRPLVSFTASHACDITDLNVYTFCFIFIIANGISVAKYKGMGDFIILLLCTIILTGEKRHTRKFITSVPSILFVSYHNLHLYTKTVIGGIINYVTSACNDICMAKMRSIVSKKRNYCISVLYLVCKLTPNRIIKCF